MKKNILVFILFFFILAGCSDDERTAEIISVKNEPNLEKKELLLEKTTDEKSYFSDISIQALTKKQFDGRDLKIGNILADNSIYTRYYITYMSGDLRISGIMNVPKGKGTHPIAILNHGHIDTKIYTNGRGLKREQDYLAKNGFVVIHSDYRNHADSDKDHDSDLHFRLGYAEDVINAIYAVKNSTFDFMDKENIFMLGHSMGGGVALNIMVSQPDLVKAYVLFAPVSADVYDNFERWTTRRPEVAKKIIEKYGDINTSPDFWKNISVNNFLENIQAPIMIHHGTSDADVPLAWSEKLEKNLKEKNKNVTLYTYQGEPHEFINAWPQVMRRTLDFYRLYTK